MVEKKSNSDYVIAAAVEIICGWFGWLGMGWLYVGNVPVWATLFFSYLAVVVLAITVFVVVGLGTLGCGWFPLMCVAGPVYILIPIVSGMKLADHVRDTGARGSFGHILAVVLIFVFSCVVSGFFVGLLFWGVSSGL